MEPAADISLVVFLAGTLTAAFVAGLAQGSPSAWWPQAFGCTSCSPRKRRR